MSDRWLAVSGAARRVLWWLAGVLVTVQLLVSSMGSERTSEGEHPPGAAVNVGQTLEIVSVRPKKPHPGGHLVLGLPASSAGHTDPPRARLGGYELVRVPTQGSLYVFRLPGQLPPGEYALQLTASGVTGPSRHIEIGEPSRRKLLRNLVGGLALLLFGMHLVARAIRRLGGHDLRRLLGRGQAGPSRVLGVAMSIGAVGQMATTTGTLVAALLRHRLLSLSSAVTFWLWAQLGSAVTGAALPLLPVREALLVVALGVFWLLLAADRRGRALARFVLGLGLLLQGVQLLRVGFGTLGEAPMLSPGGLGLTSGGLAAVLLACFVGVLAGALLQGPGPVFVLIVGYVQSTAALSMAAALALALGSWLGNAGIGYLSSLRSPPAARHAAGVHVVCAAVSVAVGLLLVPWALEVAELLIGTDPWARVYGKKVSLPEVRWHLAVAYVGLQAALVGTSVAMWRLWQRRPESQARAEPAREGRSGSEDPESVGLERGELLAVLQGQGRVVEGCSQQLLTASSRDSTRIDALLAECEGPMHKLMADCSDRGGPADAEASGLAQAAVIVEDPARLARVVMALVNQHQALVHLFHSIERWQQAGGRLRDRDRETIESMHTLVVAGLQALEQGLLHEAGTAPDAAKAREIALNGLDARHRELEFDGGPATEIVNLPARVAIGEVVGAYEALGNQIYRCAEPVRQLTAR